MVAQIKNNACNTVPGCKVEDKTGPGTPQIRVALASAGVAKKGSGFWANSPPASPRLNRDPAYIEVGNWEPGTRLQILNKSANPTASFANSADIITLEPTGRDINARVASVWIPHDMMEKLDLDSGNAFMLRAIDADDNCSAPVRGRLQGNGYGTVGRIREKMPSGPLVPGSQVRMLDGEGAYKTMLLKHIADSTPPVVKHFEKALSLDTDAKGNVTLKSTGTLEDGATVNVMNGRTGQSKGGRVDGNENIAVALGDGIANGDTLYVTVSDVNGNAAGKFEVRYSKDCKSGRGSTLGILAARLPGAIKQP